MSSVLEIVDELDEVVEETLLDVESEVEMESQEGLKKYITDKNRFKVYRLKRKVEKYWRHPLIVTGYFGTRKTLTTKEMVEEMVEDPSYGDVVWIFTSPLRALRNKISSLFKGNGFTMRAHDELIKKTNDGRIVEEPLRNHIREVRRELLQKYVDRIDDENFRRKLNTMTYFIALHRHRQEVKQGNEECWWIREVAELIEYVKNGGKIVVTTHGLLPVVFSILGGYFKDRKIRVIIDESESFFGRISTGFPVDDLELIRSLDRRIYYNLKRFFVRDEESRRVLFTSSDLLFEILMNSIMISATMPKILLESVELFLRARLARRGISIDYPVIKTHPMRDERRARDTVILYDQVLRWDDTVSNLGLIKRWLHLLAEKSIRKYGCFGILTRNYDLSKELYKFFVDLGFKVFSDHRGSPNRAEIRRGRWRTRIETDKEIIMIMVSGPIKQGIDIIPKSSRVGDVKIVVGFYQGKEDAKLHPSILREMHEGLREYSKEYDLDVDELDDIYKEQKLMARNLQALHRFSRIRENEHIYILLDKRWEKAFEEYFYDRYWRSMNKYKSENLDVVFMNAYKLI